MTNIQIRLRESRKQKGYTQSDIATFLGISQQAYQKVESGKTEDMRISTLIRLCEILDISADWLLGIGESNIVEFPQPLYIGLDVGNTYSAISVETENGKE